MHVHAGKSETVQLSGSFLSLKLEQLLGKHEAIIKKMQYSLKIVSIPL